jgi:hypothetical protein
MKPASAKAKGRALQNWVAERISRLIQAPWGADQPIEPRRMGQNGVDIRLDVAVRKSFPWSVECKNTERWEVASAIKQVKEQQYSNTDWVVFFRKNRHEEIAVLNAEVFFEILSLIPDEVKGRKPKKMIRRKT